MMTLEKLNAKQAREIAELTRKHRIAAQCPIIPDIVVLHRASRPASLLFTGRKLCDFADIFKAWQIAPLHVWRDGLFTTVAPSAKPGATDADGAGYAFYLETSQADSYSVLANINFTALLPDGEIVNVSVRIDGNLHKLASSPNSSYDNRSGRLISRSFTANSVLHGFADKTLNYSHGSSGAIASGAIKKYLFCSEHDEIMPAADCLRALGQWENLVEWSNS